MTGRPSKSAGAMGVGFTARQVTVDHIVAARGVAVCKEANTGRMVDVALRPVRVKPPVVGEIWIIDRTFGNVWSFAALLKGTFASGGGGGEPFTYTSTGWGDILVPTPFTFAAPYASMPVVTYGYSMGNSWTTNPSDTSWMPLPRCFGGVASWVMSGGSYAGANVFVAVDAVGIESVQVHHNFVFQASA